jgi:hypothetical protein
MRRMMFVLCLPGASQFWGALDIDLTVSTDKSSSSPNFTSSSFSTPSSNELLRAFVCADAKSARITVTSVRGANLTWVGLAHKFANGRCRNLADLCTDYSFNLT